MLATTRQPCIVVGVKGALGLAGFVLVLLLSACGDSGPVVLGEPVPLSDAASGLIVEELRERAIADESARATASTDDDFREVLDIDADNTQWLREQVSEVGWIDVDRFGSQAADDALLLVQHSDDLALMQAVLPDVEEDARAGLILPDTFAQLFDRTQLIAGGEQRYGSQLNTTVEGSLVLAPIESLDQVDEFRTELGLVPLAEYLDSFGEPVALE